MSQLEIWYLKLMNHEKLIFYVGSVARYIVSLVLLKPVLIVLEQLVYFWQQVCDSALNSKEFDIQLGTSICICFWGIGSQMSYICWYIVRKLTNKFKFSFTTTVKVSCTSVTKLIIFFCANGIL